jgi:hypothetical protein
MKNLVLLLDTTIMWSLKILSMISNIKVRYNRWISLCKVSITKLINQLLNYPVGHIWAISTYCQPILRSMITVSRLIRNAYWFLLSIFRISIKDSIGKLQCLTSNLCIVIHSINRCRETYKWKAHILMEVLKL